MTNEYAKKIIKQFRDRQGNSSDDIEAFDLAFKAIEQTRWIPISERLPEEQQIVIITIGKLGESSVTTCLYSKGSIFWDELVTAWMPLPEPYVPDTNVGEMLEIQTGSESEG